MHIISTMKGQKHSEQLPQMFFLLSDTVSICGVMVKLGSSSQIETFLGHHLLSLEKSGFASAIQHLGLALHVSASKPE